MQYALTFVATLSLAAAAPLLMACSDDGGALPGAGAAGAGNGGKAGGPSGGNPTGGVAGAASGGGQASSGGGAGGASSAGAVTGGSGGGGSSAGAGGAGGAGGTLSAPFRLVSPAFDHVEGCSEQNHAPCEVFPTANIMTSIGGQNLSPELSWGPGPPGTLSYAVVLHDYSNGFTHWAMWNIPGATLKLPANLPREMNPATPAGAEQVSFNNDDGGYQGPGADDHVYEFRLYALKVADFSPAQAADQGAVRTQLETDADQIVLGTSDLRGKSPP